MPEWQAKALKAGLMDEKNPQRRVQGLHDVRWDGLSDLLLRARGRSILDVGANRGHTLYDFALNGATCVHGCDVYGPGMAAAQHWFAEIKDCEAKFVAVDLTKPDALGQAFGNRGYDIVLMIGVLHKLKREMSEEAVSTLMQDLGQRAINYFGWSGYPEEIPQLDIAMAVAGLKRVHLSEMAGEGRPAAIWRR